MTRHVAVVAGLYTGAGALIGLPSLIALAYLLWAIFGTQLPPETASKADYESLPGLLVAGAQTAGKGLRLFIQGSRWAMILFAGLTGITSSIGIGMFAAGRGLGAGQTWARVMAIALAVCVLLLTAPVFVFVRHWIVLAVALAMAGTSIYTIWALM